MDEKQTKEKIMMVLEKIRPFINHDGGDLEFVDFKDGIVYVKLLGACAGCSMIDSTLQDGIANLLMEEVDGVLGVMNVSDDTAINPTNE